MAFKTESTCQKVVLVIHEHNDLLRQMMLNLLAADEPRILGLAAANEVIPNLARGVNVILLDLEAPDTDVLQLCRCIRSAHPHLGILATSTRSGADRVDSALEAGADHVLVKPFCLTETRAHVRRALRRTRAWKDALEAVEPLD